MNYTEVTKSAPVVLVEFFASWCPHCQRMMPVVDQVKEAVGDNVRVYQFDIDQYKELAEENNVEGIPTFIIYKDGRQTWRHSGELDAQLLLDNLK